jgi:hypothetical protein
MSADLDGLTLAEADAGRRRSEIISALRDLLASPGWQLLEAQIAREWGPEGYGRRMQEALSRIKPGPDRAYELAAVAETVEATARAVEQIRRWPAEQIKALSPEKPKGPFASLRRAPARS